MCFEVETQIKYKKHVFGQNIIIETKKKTFSQKKNSGPVSLYQKLFFVIILVCLTVWGYGVVFFDTEA